MTEVRVPSRTTPGDVHRVLIGIDGETSCDCAGGTYRGGCWAQKKVREEYDMTDQQSQALVPIKVTPPKSLIPSAQDLAAVAMLAESIMPARGFMFPRELDHPGKVVAVMAMGLSLGVSAMDALRSIYIVNGRPQPSAELMAGIVMAAEKDIAFEVVELTDTVCTARIKRPARDIEAEYTYTIEDARKANLIKPGNPWSTFPRDMLKHACFKRLCRAYAPDLVHGLSSVGVSSADEEAPASPPRYIDATADAAAPRGVDTDTGEVMEFTDEPAEAEFREVEPVPADDAPPPPEPEAPARAGKKAGPIPAWKRNLTNAMVTSGVTTDDLCRYLGSPAEALNADVPAWLREHGGEDSHEAMAALLDMARGTRPAEAQAALS